MSPQCPDDDDLQAIREGIQEVEDGNVFTEEQIKDEVIKIFPFLKKISSIAIDNAQDGLSESDI